MTKEDNLQIAVADYLRLQYPKVLFTHIANERQTTPQRGAKLKRMGVKKGMPDFTIFEPVFIRDYRHNVKFCGLAIELKIKPNKLTKEQKEVLERLKSCGWQTDVCYDFDQAKKTIDEYFKL